MLINYCRAVEFDLRLVACNYAYVIVITIKGTCNKCNYLGCNGTQSDGSVRTSVLTSWFGMVLVQQRKKLNKIGFLYFKQWFTKQTNYSFFKSIKF